jgi:hypothetical protein
VLFEQLDFIYSPCRDVAAELAYFVDVLGASPAFAIEGMGTRVAMLELGTAPPHLLLADHLEGDRPVLVYRVADLSVAMRELASRAGGSAAQHWRFHRDRSARSSHPAATGWPSTSSRVRRSFSSSPVGATSDFARPGSGLVAAPAPTYDHAGQEHEEEVAACWEMSITAGKSWMS